MNSTVHLVVGPDAGRGRADSAHATILDTLRSEGADVVDITGDDAAQTAAAVAAAVAAGSRRVIVAGGDGLVHLALQPIATTDTVLGVIPVGTGNDFVRGLGRADLDVVEASRAALGDPQPLDAIRAGATWVASVATAGFSGDVNARANRLRFPRGPSRYTLATMLELPGLTARPIRMLVDGEHHDQSMALVAIANTGWFGGGMQICPAAEPDDGFLEVTVVDAVGRIELLRFFRLVFSGRHMDHPRVRAYRGREIRVESDGLAMWGDGEQLDPATTTFTAVPGAIRVAQRS